MAGFLFIVATPIGNLEDASPRALKVLSEVDLILAEDTRYSKRLLDFFKIKNKILAMHEHNEKKLLDKILQELAIKNIALISDAGTPLISDPGFSLVKTAKDKGFSVVPIPGPSAVISALSASGLPSTKFCFEGFLPKQQTALENYLQDLADETRTMIFYESPKRTITTLNQMQEIFGSERLGTVARELTKKHENIITDTLGKLYEIFNEGKEPTRGEFVILVSGAEDNNTSEHDVEEVLQILMTELSMSKAVKLTSQITGINKNQVYETALRLKANK